MIGTPDELFFSINAEADGALRTFQQVAQAADKAKKSVDGLAGAGSGNKTVSDRQIKKAFGQDYGDLLESLGITENGLQVIKTAGVTVLGFQAALSTLSNTLNGIRDNKSASQIWTDIAKGLPVLGGIAAAADEAGKALAEFYSSADLGNDFLAAATGHIENVKGGSKDRASALIEKDKREKADAEARKKLLEGITSGGIGAREQQRIASSANPEVTRAQIEFEKTLKDVEDKKRQIYSIDNRDISNEARAKALKDLNDQLEAASGAVVRAQAEVDKKKAEMAQKARDEEAKRNKESAEQMAKDIIEARKQAEEEAAQARDKRNQEQMQGSADLLQQIDALKQGQTDKLVEVSKGMRFGALAETAGIGTANQLASRERASFNPLIKLAQEAATRDERKLKALEGLYAMAQRGEVTPIFLN